MHCAFFLIGLNRLLYTVPWYQSQQLHSHGVCRSYCMPQVSPPSLSLLAKLSPCIYRNQHTPPFQPTSQGGGLCSSTISFLSTMATTTINRSLLFLFCFAPFATITIRIWKGSRDKRAAACEKGAMHHHCPCPVVESCRCG